MTAYIGPVGALIPFKCPSSSEVGLPSRSTFRVTGAGRVKEQRGPRARRRWSVDIGTSTPASVAGLAALVDGSFGPPPWVWVDPWAMVTNLLSPEASLLESGTWRGNPPPEGGQAPAVGGAEWMPDGLRAGRVILNPSAVQLFFGYRVSGGGDAPAVVPGVKATGSAYVTGLGQMQLRFYTATGALLEINQTAFNTTSWQRVSATAIPPAGAATALLTATGATKAALPAVTWTPDMAAWSVGKGCNRATVDGLAEAVQIAVIDQPYLRRSSLSFTVQELG